MLYNLRIGKSRFAGKSITECCDIIAARAGEINALSRCKADHILFELRGISETYYRIVYYGHDGKIYISINRRETK